MLFRSSDSDCENDGCQAVESGGYKVENNQTAIIAALNAVVFLETLLSLENQPLYVELLAVSSAAPPELQKCWQFSSRTALLPRAPSFVS